jgi:hypothetical protein
MCVWCWQVPIPLVFPLCCLVVSFIYPNVTLTATGSNDFLACTALRDSSYISLCRKIANVRMKWLQSMTKDLDMSAWANCETFQSIDPKIRPRLNLRETPVHNG